MNKPVIVCAALRSKTTGCIIAGARHFDSIMRAQIIRLGGILFNEDGDPAGFDDEWLNPDDGFIDQFGNFLTREEAWTIAKKNNQIKHILECNGAVLYSENLY